RQLPVFRGVAYDGHIFRRDTAASTVPPCSPTRMSVAPSSRFIMHEQAFSRLQDAMQALRQNHMSIADFCRVWRAQTELLQVLPPRFATVMEDLLGRLEAGSLFTEESCSFSQIDLLATLDTWLDRAQQTVASQSE